MMNYNFDKYDDVTVNIYRDNKNNKNNKNNKYNKHNDDNRNKDKILISRKRDSRYSPKNLRIINKDLKDFNNSENTTEQIYWDWDWDFGFASDYIDNQDNQDNLYNNLDYSSIRASPSLSCSSSSSYLMSFDIPWIEL